MKKGTLFIIIVVYLLIGFVLVMIEGFPHDLSVFEYITTILTVMIGWPFFVIMQLLQ